MSTPKYLDSDGVAFLWKQAKTTFSAKSHTHTMANISDLKNQVPKNATRVNSGYDLNNYNSSTHCGYYYAGGSNNCLSKPSGVDAFGLQVVKNADGYIMQILYASNNSKNDIYTRVYGGGAWTGWEKLAQSGDLTWANLSGKPSTFTPSSHTHTSANITDLASKLEEAKSEVKDDLLGGAGTAFDTLQELANALGQDPNFATTVSNELGKKANSSDVYKKSEVYTRSEANDRYLLSHPLFTENAWGIDWGLDAGKPLGLTVHYGQYALFQVLKGSNNTFNVVVNADSFHRLGNSASDKREIVDEVSLLNLVYPVGSIYMSFSNTSPASFLGGTWARLSNTFLYASTSDVVASSLSRYGSSTAKLSVSNLPDHKHTTNIVGDQSSSSDWIALNSQWGKYQAITDIVYADDQGMDNSSFSIMPPYTKVYMWRRTA